MNNQRYPDSAIAPARHAFAIVAGVQVTVQCKGIYVGTGGDLVVKLKDTPAGNVTLKNVASGQMLDIDPDTVDVTSTAADIVGLA
ncbi:hypothetical protein [Novosphingobium sp.]|uniref:spike base protein, RCAP_Rcc01079 family n=1 Tax=Novosphingobium sp. TaxID=1874826 RepID=UPI0038BACEFF